MEERREGHREGRKEGRKEEVIKERRKEEIKERKGTRTAYVSDTKRTKTVRGCTRAQLCVCVRGCTRACIIHQCAHVCV